MTLNNRTAFYILSGTWLAVFWSDIYRALQIYLESGYDYQGLIAPFAIILMSRYKNPDLKRCIPQFSWLGFLFIFFAVLCCQCASILQLETAKFIAMLSIVPGIILLTCGKKTVQILSFQLLCLILLLPAGQNIFLHMQNLFFNMVVYSALLLSGSVYWDGNNIYIGESHYLISSIFISLQYVMLYLTFGTLCATFAGKTLVQRLAISSNFVTLPFLMLYIAFVAIILLKIDFSESKLNTTSWIISWLGIALATTFAKFIYKHNSRVVLNNDIDWKNAYPKNAKSMLLSILCALTLLFSNTIVQNVKFDPQIQDCRNLHAPSDLATWGHPIVVSDNEGKDFLAEYKKNKQSIFLASNDSKLPNQLLDMPHHEWDIIKSSSNKAIVNGKEIKVLETILRKNDISRIIWTFYSTNGEYSSDQRKQHTIQRFYGILGKKIESTTTSIATHVDTDLKAGRDTLRTFLDEYMLE